MLVDFVPISGFARVGLLHMAFEFDFDNHLNCLAGSFSLDWSSC